MKRIVLILLPIVLLMGCCNKADHAKHEKLHMKARYALYPVTEKSGGIGSIGDQTSAFLLDKKTGKVWMYNSKFAAFIKVKFLEAVALPADQDQKEAVEKYKSAFTPDE